MKKTALSLAMLFTIAGVFAQDAVKLKTIRTNYGVIQNQKARNFGLLDKAIINTDTLSEFVLMTSAVNVSNDTFPMNTPLQQCYEVYFYSETGSMVYSLGQLSGKNGIETGILPGDTCNIYMLGLDVNSMRAYAEHDGIDWSKVAYWRLIVGFCYSGLEGNYYPSKKFYAGADTSTFHVLYKGDGVASAKNDVLRCRVFPNPVSEVLHIDLPEMETGIARITVCDMLGKVMLQKENLSQPELNVSSLAAGSYTVQLVSNTGKVFSSKILVKQ